MKYNSHKHYADIFLQQITELIIREILLSRITYK